MKLIDFIRLTKRENEKLCPHCLPDRIYGGGETYILCKKVNITLPIDGRNIPCTIEDWHFCPLSKD